MKKIVIATIAALFLTACGNTSKEDDNSSREKNKDKTTTGQSVVVDNRSKAAEETKDNSKENETVSETTQETETTTEATTETTTVTEPIVEEKKLSDDDFSVKGYWYEDSIGDSCYYAIVTNNSTETVEMVINAVAKDSNGNLIGADDGTIDVLGSGETSICELFFDSVSDIADIEYSLSYSTENYYKPVVGGLSSKQTINNENVIVEVTNNNDYPAEFVQAYALFFDASGHLVDSDYTYIIDNENVIKPGVTLTKQLDTYDDFDYVEVYFTGRAGK